MNRLRCTAFFAFVLSGLLGITGCGGAPENSVAAPPENPPTAEEIDAQAQEYADQEKELRERDQRD